MFCCYPVGFSIPSVPRIPGRSPAYGALSLIPPVGGQLDADSVRAPARPSGSPVALPIDPQMTPRRADPVARYDGGEPEPAALGRALTNSDAFELYFGVRPKHFFCSFDVVGRGMPRSVAQLCALAAVNLVYDASCWPPSPLLTDAAASPSQAVSPVIQPWQSPACESDEEKNGEIRDSTFSHASRCSSPDEFSETRKLSDDESSFVWRVVSCVHAVAPRINHRPVCSLNAETFQRQNGCPTAVFCAKKAQTAGMPEDEARFERGLTMKMAYGSSVREPGPPCSSDSEDSLVMWD